MLKPISPDATTSAISMTDPAIDYDASEKAPEELAKRVGMSGCLQYAVDALVRPASWRDTVKFKDGCEPTVFSIGIVPPSTLARIEDETRGEGAGRVTEKYWRCFLAGIRKVAPWDGKVPMKTVNGIEYVDPEWLASTFCGHLRTVGIEIGRMVYSWQMLTGEDVKN
jgi:hypothetical protein